MSLSTSQNVTILAFDFGLKRIGVAVGNTFLKQAQALTVISAESNNAKFDAIAALLKEWQVTHCVVGFPSHPDGVEHEMSARCRRFANQLEGRFGVSTTLVDERYTSAVIPSKRGDIIDALSAELILQQYFDETS
ncbi:Holliday junction resolvase RuvX [Sapientia aquatica]|uniref:Putative pre-16S rRNA nuclease n=1 Tax=Sapientia aquatica TaxID=1549640 RepID=A0A4R5VNU1_9BURK|nr:Holliday junction resolvase RuvX [Sapientia aquatica]